MKIEKPDVDEPSTKRVRWGSTTHPIATMSQLIYTTDRFSIIRDFVERAGMKIQFADAEDKNRGSLRAKSENPRRK